jgi:hypothetical protein
MVWDPVQAAAVNTRAGGGSVSSSVRQAGTVWLGAFPEIYCWVLCYVFQRACMLRRAVF